MYSVCSPLNKDVTLTVRVTPEMYSSISRNAERAEVSLAEVVRRSVRYTLSDDVILISLNNYERTYLEEVANNLGVMPSEAIKMQLLTMKVLENYGVLKTIKPITEMLEELEVRKKREEATEDEPE
jgi:hypothetical protein